MTEQPELDALKEAREAYRKVKDYAKEVAERDGPTASYAVLAGTLEAALFIAGDYIAALEQRVAQLERERDELGM